MPDNEEKSDAVKAIESAITDCTYCKILHATIEKEQKRYEDFYGSHLTECGRYELLKIVNFLQGLQYHLTRHQQEKNHEI